MMRLRQRAAEPPAEIVAEVSSLRNDVAQMKQLMEGQLQERADLVARAAHTVSGPSDAGFAPAVARSERRALTPERMEEIQRRGLEMRARYFEFLDGRFAGEVRDGPWASSMEQKAKDVLLDPDLAGNKLEQITCQRTLCKMTVTHADFTARGEFISFAGRVPELPNATYRQVTDELGRMTTVAFFARQGFNIPPPPDELVRKNAPP